MFIALNYFWSKLTDPYQINKVIIRPYILYTFVIYTQVARLDILVKNHKI